MSLVKSGDGRILVGFLATFMIVGSFLLRRGRFFARKICQACEVFDRELIEDTRIRLEHRCCSTDSIRIDMEHNNKKEHT